MRKNSRPHWILAHLLLLIVSGVQAITPDADSLASAKALNIVAQLAGDGRLASDAADSGCLAICESFRPSRIVHSRNTTGNGFRISFSCDFSRTPLVVSSAGPPRAFPVRVPSKDRLFQALCRMVCRDDAAREFAISTAARCSRVRSCACTLTAPSLRTRALKLPGPGSSEAASRLRGDGLTDWRDSNARLTDSPAH